MFPLDGPGVIKIKGNLKEILPEQSPICGRSLNQLARVWVEEVIAVGTGISQPLQKDEIIHVQFHCGFNPRRLTEGQTLPGLTIGTSFQAQIREKLCISSNEVYYELFVYSLP